MRRRSVLQILTALLCVAATASAQEFATAPSKPLSYTGGHCPLAPISGLRIAATNGPAISVADCPGVVIENCVFAFSPDEAIRIERCDKVKIKNCFFSDVGGGIYVSRSRNVQVDGNQFSDITRRDGSSRGQFVQFNEVTGDSSSVTNNVGENIGGHSAPEDLVNLFKCAGTPASPILIANNQFRGGGPSEHGGGILAGDNGGENISITNNTLVNPGQFGLGSAGGTSISITNNRVFGARFRYSNVGIYVSNFGPGGCGTMQVTGNQVNWTSKNGNKAPFYNFGNCGLIVGQSTNDFDAPFGSEILPAELLAPDPVVNLAMNGTFSDLTGITPLVANQHVDFVDDGVGSCARFNGTDSYLSLPSSVWWKPSSQKISVSLWAKPDGMGGIQGLMRSADADGYTDGWRLMLQDGFFKPRLTTTAGSAELACDGLIPDRWNLLAFTYDGRKFTGYVNGVARESVRIKGDILYNHRADMVLGYSNGDNYWYKGKIDEVRVNRGLLSEATLAAVYGSEKEKFDGLIAYYPLDGDLLDASGNGFDGHSADVRFSTDGRVGGSAIFNGAARFGVSSSPLLKPTNGQLTVAGWIHPSSVKGLEGIAHAPDARGWADGWRMAVIKGFFSTHVVTSAGMVDAYAPGLIDGEWNHVAFTYDGSAVLVYVNGINTGKFPLHGDISYTHHSDMEFGYCEGLDAFTGGMDEMRIYRSALDSLTIAALAHARSNRVESFGIDASGVADSTGPAWKVFPNPGASAVYFTVSAVADEERAVTITIYDLRGRRLFRQPYQIRAGIRYPLDVSLLPQGIYLVECRTPKRRLVQQLLLRR